MATKGLFHVSMIVEAGALYAVTAVAAENKARDVQINPVLGSAGKKNGAANEGDKRPPARTVLIPWWTEHKHFTMKDAILFGVEHGYNKGAVYTATLSAMKHGLLQRTGAGDYKTLAAINKVANGLNGANGSTHGNAKANRQTKTKPQKNEIVHTDFVLKQLGAGVVTTKAIGEAFVADGRKKRSIDGAIGRLKAVKMITNTGPGEYKLLAKGVEHLKSL